MKLMQGKSIYQCTVWWVLHIEINFNTHFSFRTVPPLSRRPLLFPLHALATAPPPPVMPHLLCSPLHNCVCIIVPPSIIYCNTLDMFYFFLQPLNFSQLAFLVKKETYITLSFTKKLLKSNGFKQRLLTLFLYENIILICVLLRTS